MPKGKHSEDNPSFVITAKMNPQVSELEREAWDIWQGINHREVIRAGFTTKAELLASALIQYRSQHPIDNQSNVEKMLSQILSKLNNGVIFGNQPINEDVSDIMLDFAQNHQMMESVIEGNE